MFVINASTKKVEHAGTFCYFCVTKVREGFAWQSNEFGWLLLGPKVMRAFGLSQKRRYAKPNKDNYGRKDKLCTHL